MKELGNIFGTMYLLQPVFAGLRDDSE